MNFLAVIPARAGSKGVLRKNIKPLNGVPLIFYTIDTARGCLSDENICVTTNDVEIIDIVKQQKYLNVPFIRPEELATDEAGTHEVLLHAIQFYEKNDKKFDAVILLQPTSPLRTSTNLKECIELYKNSIVDMVVSVKETKANPYFTLFEENEEGYLYQSKHGNYTRRQDCPKVYEYNGAIYVINVDSLKNGGMNSFKKIKKYVMSNRNSIDIDTTEDFEYAEFLISKK